jgi:hypothetical protein
MAEAVAQSAVQIEGQKQLLEQHKAGEGGELLVVKAQGGKAMGFMQGIEFATLHGGRFLLVVIVWLAPSILPQPANRLFIFHSTGTKKSEKQ